MPGLLIEAASSCLLAVDLQEHLAPAIAGRAALLGKARFLLQAAGRLSVPVLLTEQYPKGLGHTLPEIAELAPQAARIEKTAFSSWAEPAFRESFRALGRSQVVLMGTEAHVCVLQTGLGLLGEGVALFVVADAVGSRDPADTRLALRRLERAGAVIVSAEMVVFEWLERAASEDFRDLLPLIKQGPSS